MEKSGNKLYLNIAMFACITSALICLASVIIGFINKSSSVNMYLIFTNCWNAIFYLIVGNFYYRSRDYKGRALQATLILAICTFLIPSIIELIYGLIYGGLSGLMSTLYLLISSLLIGIVYSIALILYSRKRSKGRFIFLLVMGILLFINYLLSFISDLFIYIEIFKNIFTAISSYTTLDIVSNILNALTSLVSLAFGFTFFYTPLYLKRL